MIKPGLPGWKICEDGLGPCIIADHEAFFQAPPMALPVYDRMIAQDLLMILDSCFGEGKYRLLVRRYQFQGHKKLREEEIGRLKQVATAAGLRVKLGG
jgi:hypothetical protein